MRAKDNEKVKLDQKKMKAASMETLRADDEEQVKHDQNIRQRKHRRVMNRSDRLKEFREATMYNAIFICTCCQQRMFHSNVRLYTEDLKKEINRIKQGHIKRCVEKVVSTWITGQRRTYICLTCVKHMKNMKLPPMSAMNGLILNETDKMIQDQGLNLTELEG